MIFIPIIALICFTAIVIYRMSIDRLKMQQQHQRMVANDQLQAQRYARITQSEPPKPELPDFGVVQRRRDTIRALPKPVQNSKMDDLADYYYEAYKEQYPDLTQPQIKRYLEDSRR